MRKVMVVEDSDDYAFLLTRALNHSRRFSIVWRAKDGQEAMAYLGGTGQFSDRDRFPLPDAVLLDILLPKKSGFEVLEWLTKQPQMPIVVMLTVLENNSQRQKALNAGAHAFDVKPYDDKGLANFIRWLDEFIGKSATPSGAR